MKDLNSLIGQAQDFIIPFLLDVVGAILILTAGYIVAGWTAKRVRRVTERTDKIDITLIPVLVQTVRALILILTLLAVLGQFGVQTASIIAVLGAAGLAIGLALQGTLSNVAAGIMLLILRPFRTGDAVTIGGTSGVIDAIGMFTTELHTFDNVGIVMPNSQVWGSEIKNMSMYDTRRMSLTIGIGYNDDVDKAMSTLKELIAEDRRILSDPEPLVAVESLGDNSVNLLVRVWTVSGDLWSCRYDFMKRVKQVFDEKGISFPYPQREIRLIKED